MQNSNHQFLSDIEGLQALELGQLYLWTAATAGQNLAHLQSILCEDEKMRAQKFRHAEARLQFITAHALVRLALSQHCPFSAVDWRFDRDQNGRPFIATPKLLPQVHFSLSHTEGLVACLVTLSSAAAVDVEKVRHRPNLELVARKILSATELRALDVLSGEEWTNRFFDYWTLKEAYAKAQGIGLHAHLNDIRFDFAALSDEQHSNVVSIANVTHPKWLFWRCHPQSHHAISVAVRNDLAAEYEIIHRPVNFISNKMVVAAAQPYDFISVSAELAREY